MSKHYTETKPELGKWIATYDILNEPTYEYNTKTTEECWENVQYEYHWYNWWSDTLQLFDDRNYSWTIWNYKSTVTGWWTTSWGVYTCQLKAVTENEDLKCNIATCTYEEYLATCEKVKTENCVTATLYEVIREYNK